MSMNMALSDSQISTDNQKSMATTFSTTWVKKT